MRENEVHVTWDRDEMASVMSELCLRLKDDPALREGILDEYEKRRSEGADMPCQSKVWHGPGHQSSTFCQSTGGPAQHDENKAGAVLHCADLPSGGFAEWTDDDPFYRGWE